VPWPRVFGSRRGVDVALELGSADPPSSTGHPLHSPNESVPLPVSHEVHAPVGSTVVRVAACPTQQPVVLGRLRVRGTGGAGASQTGTVIPLLL